jgi:competence ComEA-like helix-hairpin-helix protein
MSKPGYKTTEFWFTLVSFIVSGLFLGGIITDPNAKDELIEVISHAVESCVLLSGQAVILYKYIQSRKEQKIAYEKSKQKEAELINKELEDYVGVDDSSNKININTASMGQLIQLPHVGPVTAKKIISHRKHQAFEKIADIQQIVGIGKNSFKDLKPYIIV